MRSCGRRGPGGHPEQGSVTAEAAVVLPALAAVLALSLWAVAAVTGQLQCVDAARVAARALARGESPSRATTVAREAAPAGAAVTVDRSGDLVVVHVSAVARFPGPWSRAPALHVDGRAAAMLEQPFVPGPLP